MTETHQPNSAEETATPGSTGPSGSTAPESSSTTPSGGQVEEFSISGDNLVAKIRELIDESNVRRIVIKTHDDQELIEIPLTVGVTAGVIGTALFPLLAAVGAIGGLVANLKLVVLRTDQNDSGS